MIGGRRTSARLTGGDCLYLARGRLAREPRLVTSTSESPEYAVAVEWLEAALG